MRWYLSGNGETVGPLEGSRMVELAREGKLSVGNFVRDEAGGTWMPIECSPFTSLIRGAHADSRPMMALSRAEYRLLVRDAVAWGVLMALTLLGLMGGLLVIVLRLAIAR